jgi:endonuclease YncB( thermonuclease family)
MAVVGFIAAAIMTQMVIWASRWQSPFTQEASAICIGRVTDGDTFQMCDGGKVRLVAASGPIDAPETSYRPGRWNDQNLAKQAQQRLEQLLKGGALQCEGLDRYERRLCRVTVDGKDVGDQLVAEGLAVVRNDWR